LIFKRHRRSPAELAIARFSQVVVRCARYARLRLPDGNIAPGVPPEDPIAVPTDESLTAVVREALTSAGLVKNLSARGLSPQPFIEHLARMREARDCARLELQVKPSGKQPRGHRRGRPVDDVNAYAIFGLMQLLGIAKDGTAVAARDFGLIAALCACSGVFDTGCRYDRRRPGDSWCRLSGSVGGRCRVTGPLRCRKATALVKSHVRRWRPNSGDSGTKAV
jgi:hypothetical protein